MRRNAPCHCGSGKRFKHCHGRFDAENPLQRQRFEAAQRQRRLQQGFGKPIQSYLLRDSRAVVVGRALMIGKWSAFTDFLLEYFAERIGPQWIASEMRLGEAAHPIAQWAVEMNRDRRSQPAGIGVVKRKVNNASRSLDTMLLQCVLLPGGRAHSWAGSVARLVEHVTAVLQQRFRRRVRRPERANIVSDAWPVCWRIFQLDTPTLGGTRGQSSPQTVARIILGIDTGCLNALANNQAYAFA
jgi:hypothetical protein